MIRCPSGERDDLTRKRQATGGIGSKLAFEPGAAAQERSDGCAGVVRGGGSPVGGTLALALLRFAPELRKNALPYIRSCIVEYEKRGEDDRKNKKTAAAEDTQ